ncbi:MAG: aminotransferase class V-fold PLP-dependent enzyme [Clostridia bacterium]|nr:aminotransferase class V-fold PLP-dependent enzyme [Clostridia bacterium]
MRTPYKHSRLHPIYILRISDIEHNSVLRPIDNLSRQKLCSYDIFKTDGSDDDIVNNIIGKLKMNTSMIVCTHISNVGERRLPIEKIGKLCKDRGLIFVVDGAQSAGILDISVKKMNIDALCVPGHKGLYGPQGVGAIVFKDDNVGRSVLEGGTGINSLELNMPDFLPEAYEAGTLSTPCIVGLNESLKWLKTVGIDKIRDREENLYGVLYDLIKDNKNIVVYKMNNYNGNTLCFNIEGIPSNIVAKELDNRGICVRSGFHCSPLGHKVLKTDNNGAVRISIGAFNSKNDIYTVYEAINDISKKLIYNKK